MITRGSIIGIVGRILISILDDFPIIVCVPMFYSHHAKYLVDNAVEIEFVLRNKDCATDMSFRRGDHERRTSEVTTFQRFHGHGDGAVFFPCRGSNCIPSCIVVLGNGPFTIGRNFNGFGAGFQAEPNVLGIDMEVIRAFATNKTHGYHGQQSRHKKMGSFFHIVLF